MSKPSSTNMGDILLTRTNGSHGIGDITKFTGEVSGLVLSHADEQKLYIAGDTVWYSDVQAAIDTHEPSSMEAPRNSWQAARLL